MHKFSSTLIFSLMQLEYALTSERRGPTERRITKLKTQSAPESTEEELSEVGSTRSRPRSRRTIIKPASKPRTRSSTASSTQTIPSQPEEVKKKKSVPDRLRSTVATTAEAETTKTPTRNSFLDVTNDDHSTPEPSSPAKSKDTLGKAGVSALGTSDSDTDFQSAYSASPRESYASFESGKPTAESDDDSTLLLQSVPENHEDRFSAVPKTRRERVSSTATAILKREKSEPRATNTLPSRNRIPSKQM
jgi:nicotinamide N-methyltransferase